MNRSDDAGDMDRMDELVHRGLTAATDEVDGIEPAKLARQLTERRGRVARRRTRSRMVAVAAAVVLIAAAATGGWALLDGDGEVGIAAVDSEDPEPNPLVGYDAGWHEIDPGPVPAMLGVSLAWTGEELIVAGTAGDGGGAANPGVYSYDPIDRSWQQLPEPPFGHFTMVAVGDGLVAVASDPVTPTRPIAHWASWATGDDRWVDHGAVPMAPALESAGASGPEGLLWTGERVVDLSHGAVLDPSTGAAEPLPMPEDVVAYTHLITATPAWTGAEVVLSAWSTEPGLAWDDAGTTMREVPGLPAEVAGPRGVTGASDAVVLDGQLILLSGNGDLDDAGPARAAALDLDSSTWTRLPDLPIPPVSKCPYRSAVVGDALVTRTCASGTQPPALLLFDDGRWSGIEVPPWPEDGWIADMLGTDDALFAWSSDTDTHNNPDAPYRRGAIWIPTHAESVPASTPPTCDLDGLPDLSGALPERLDPGPAPGVGGMSDSDGQCARHWGSSTEPGVHVTQRPGPAPFTVSSASASGHLRWGTIHEGWGIESTEGSGWSAMAYGLTGEEIAALVEALLEGADRTGPMELHLDPLDGEGSSMTRITTTTDGDHDVIEIGFTGSLPQRINLAQADEPSAGECVPPEQLPGGPYLNIVLSLTVPEAPLDDLGQDNRLPVVTDPGGPLLSGTVACSFEAHVSLSFGLTGAVPMAVAVDPGGDTLRILLDRST